MDADEEPEKVNLNEERRDAISVEMQRTRMSAQKLATYLKKHCGCDIHPNLISGVLNGTVGCVEASKFSTIIDTLQGLPDAPRVTGNISKPSWMLITSEKRAELNRLFEQTGLNAASVVRHHQHADAKLTTAKISAWRTGRAKSADPYEWQYLVELLRQFSQ